MQRLGFDPDNLPSMKARVESVLEGVKFANEETVDLVTKPLNSKKETLQKKIHEVKRKKV